MAKWQGAYSLVILTRDGVFAVRDPWGFRPLSVGLLPCGGHAVASESGALRTLGCLGIREVQPGEIIALSNNALTVNQALKPAEPLAPVLLRAHLFLPARQLLGRAQRPPGAPEPGRAAGPGGSRPALTWSSPCRIRPSRPPSATPAPGLPYNDGFIKNRYIGRTFIEPTDSLRQQGVALKFNVIPENVRGKTRGDDR